MRFLYAPLHDQTSRDAVFHRMQAEGLTACAMSSLASPTIEQWRHITAPERGVLLGCYAAGADEPTSTTPSVDASARLLACAMFSPRRGKVWEFDFTTFRHAAALAVPMAHGGLAWAFANLDCAAVMGLCPAPNRHAWRLAESCGFRVLGRLPAACLHARNNTWVDGILVLCTPQSLAHSEKTSTSAITNHKEQAMGFGGGGTPDVPAVAPVPKQEVEKPVTEAASAARQSQKDKAAKAAGINGSVFTSPLSRSDATSKTLLGQ